MSDVLEIITREQAEAPFFLGIDVGGTGIKFGIVDDLGRTLGRAKIATQQERGPEDACERMRDTSLKLIADCGLDFDSIVHVGLATPGTMDITVACCSSPIIFQLGGISPFVIICARFSRSLLRFRTMRMPRPSANSGSAAATVQQHGAVTLGTGVGGGIIVDGRLVNGEHSHGSECGHTYIDTSEVPAIVDVADADIWKPMPAPPPWSFEHRKPWMPEEASSLTARLAAGEPLTSLMVAEEADRGDALSLRIVMETADYLSYGAVNMMHIIDPNAIIFGGAMDFGGHESELGRRFLAAIRHGVETRVFPGLSDKTIVDFASLGSDAGYIGSAGVARAEYMASR